MDDRNNTTIAWDATDMLFQDITRHYMWIIFPFGMLGNCLSMCVFFGTKLRYSSSSIYLGSLAISDIGFLVSVIIFSPAVMNITNRFTIPGFCQFFTYLGTFCGFLSVWFVVAFTVERYVAVKWPLRRQSLCTVARAKNTVLGLTVLAIPLSSPVLVFTKSHQLSQNIKFCILDKEWKSWATAYNALDTVITFAVPLTMIVIFNTLIARKIYKQDNIRRTLTIESNTSNNERIQTPRNRAPQTKVTKMLMLVSSVFFCLNMPSFVFRLLAFLYVQSNPTWLILAQRIGYLLFITSYGINFILYCVSGQNFRREMICLFTRRSGTERNGTVIQMANHGRQHEFKSKCSSTKRTHFVDDEQQKDSKETQKLSTNCEEL